MKMLTLPYPQRRDEIQRFVRKHHYTRRCAGVWSIAFAIENERSVIQAVAMYGPPPYPTITRAFVRCPEHASKLIWQTRLVGAGISSADVDRLIEHANIELLKRGYWWVLTLSDPTERVVDDALMKLLQRGFNGEVYQRTGAQYLGVAGKPKREGWLIDGKPYHIRQGAVTLSANNVREHFPEAQSFREIKGGAKQRWVYVLANNALERAERVLLMKYHVQPYEVLRQPRLLVNLREAALSQ